MGREHFLAGIAGYRPDLRYSAMDNHCLAGFPGYDKPIAILPGNTVDAVFTSNGALAYRDSTGEVRSLQIPGHEPIYAAAAAANRKEGRALKSFVTGKDLPFSQIMGRHDGGLSSAEPEITESAPPPPHAMTRQQALEALGDLSVRRANKTKAEPQDAPDRDGVNRMRLLMDKRISDLLNHIVRPLRRRITDLAKENERLTARIEKMDADRQRMLSHPLADPAPASAKAEVSDGMARAWGPGGGLPNGLAADASPFRWLRRPRG